MANEPSNPGNLPGRSRPNLSDLAKDTTESDLWNMDDEDDFSSSGLSVVPESEQETPPAASPEPPKAGTTNPNRKIPVRSSRSKPTPTAATPGSAERTETPSSTPPLSPIQPESTRDRQSSDSRSVSIGNTPRNSASRGDRRENPRASVTDTFGALDADHVPPSTPLPLPSKEETTPDPSPGTTSASGTTTEPVTEITIESATETSEPVEELWDDSPAPANPPQTHLPDVPAVVRDQPVATARPSSLARTLSGMNRRDLLAIGIFFFTLLLGALWGISQYTRQLVFKKPELEIPSTPIAGQWINITEIRTAWRKPITSGPSPDIVRRDTAVIPLVHLKIAPSSKGVLRAIFRNAQGEIVGDAISQSAQAGLFSSSNDSATTFAATSGFSQTADFRAYQAENSKPWTVELFEAPSADAPSSAFVLIARAPILRMED